jgi:hypothetical protein
MQLGPLGDGIIKRNYLVPGKGDPRSGFCYFLRDISIPPNQRLDPREAPQLPPHVPGRSSATLGPRICHSR